jgi:hypothetical protein
MHTVVNMSARAKLRDKPEVQLKKKKAFTQFLCYVPDDPKGKKVLISRSVGP